MLVRPPMKRPRPAGHTEDESDPKRPKHVGLAAQVQLPAAQVEPPAAQVEPPVGAHVPDEQPVHSDVATQEEVEREAPKLNRVNRPLPKAVFAPMIRRPAHNYAALKPPTQATLKPPTQAPPEQNTLEQSKQATLEPPTQTNLEPPAQSGLEKLQASVEGLTQMMTEHFTRMLQKCNEQPAQQGGAGGNWKRDICCLCFLLTFLMVGAVVLYIYLWLKSTYDALTDNGKITVTEIGVNALKSSVMEIKELAMNTTREAIEETAKAAVKSTANTAISMVAGVVHATNSIVEYPFNFLTNVSVGGKSTLPGNSNANNARARPIPTARLETKFQSRLAMAKALAPKTVESPVEVLSTGKEQEPARPAAAPEPVAQQAPEPAAPAVPEPVAQKASEPAAQEPVEQQAPEPEAQEPVEQQAPEPEAQESVEQQAPEPEAQEPVEQQAPEPVANTTSEPTEGPPPPSEEDILELMAAGLSRERALELWANFYVFIPN